MQNQMRKTCYLFKVEYHRCLNLLNLMSLDNFSELFTRLKDNLIKVEKEQ